MAKDRNTFAKRQREVEKKRKAEEKRQRRAKKKETGNESCEPKHSQFLLSPAERAVLRVFRNYLMTPGKMLCLGSAELTSFHRPLARLTDKGLLVAEGFEGGYSLTETGFAVMKKGE